MTNAFTMLAFFNYFRHAGLVIVAALIFDSCASIFSDYPDMDLWYRDQKILGETLAESTTPIRSQLAATKVRSPFFWEITKDGRTSYLLGTIHQGIGFGTLPREIKMRFANAKTAVFEINPRSRIRDVPEEDLKKIAYQLENRKIATRPLRFEISDGAWRVFRWDLQWIDPDILDMVSTSGARDFYVTARINLLSPSAESMDSELEAEARRGKKSIGYLETLAEVSNLLLTSGSTFRENPSDKSRAVNEILEILKQPIPVLKEQLEAQYQLAISYKSGNLQEIEKAVSPDSETYDLLIRRRNVAWLPRLENFLADGNVFISVGAGHFTGDSSLLRLLEKKGYRITRWTSRGYISSTKN